MIRIREMVQPDRAIWAEFRAALWSEDSVETHTQDIERLQHGGDTWSFIAETDKGAPVGFAEVSIRKYANGCESAPVPCLEGIWVTPEFRRRGIGQRLIRHIAAFLLARGFEELGSDALIDNYLSHAAHAVWGFSENRTRRLFSQTARPMISAPAELLKGEPGMPDLRHVRDLISCELHHVHIVRSRGLVRGRNRASGEMGADEHAIGGYVVAF